MDILAARKKAAERKQEQKQPEREVKPVPPAPPSAPSPPEPAAEQAVPVAAAAPETAVSPPPAEAVSVALPVTGEAQSAVQASSEEAAGDQPAREVEMLSFRLGGEEYALMVDDVKEVLKNRELTQVPNAPEYILGVTALRGPILAVIDLSKRLGLPPAVRDEKSRILVVSSNDEDTGIVVDRVTGVVRIHPEDIRPVPETIERGSEYLRGIVRKNDRLYILLDREKALGA